VKKTIVSSSRKGEFHEKQGKKIDVCSEKTVSYYGKPTSLKDNTMRRHAAQGGGVFGGQEWKKRKRLTKRYGAMVRKRPMKGQTIMRKKKEGDYARERQGCHCRESAEAKKGGECHYRKKKKNTISRGEKAQKSYLTHEGVVGRARGLYKKEALNSEDTVSKRSV